MSERRLLYFTASSHQLYVWRSGKLEFEGDFGDDEDGVTEFQNFAKQHAKSLYYILADLAGEDFHDEIIPWLRGSDRQAVIERRLAQRYRDTRLAAALSLGSVAVAGERRNERLLLASFTNTQQFSPWLDALASAGAKLAGVYSVPLVAPAVSARLAAKVGTKSNRLFVVSMNSAGLRQSFLEDGKVRFARLERTGEMEPEALAAFVRSETLRLVQYLSSLRVLPRDGPPITAIVITPAGQRAIFEQALPSDGRLTFRTIELPEAALASGIKGAAGIGAEQLYLHLLAKRAPKDQFARSEDRKGFLLWQLQRGVVAAGAIALAACGLFAGVKWIEIWTIRDQTSLQLAETRNAEQEYQRVTSTFPVTLTSTENLKATVNEFRSIEARSAVPGPAFSYLSRALEQFPQIELDQLSWRADRPGGPEKAPPDPSKPIAATAGAPTAAASPDSPLQSDIAQTLEISGHVNSTQRSDYRAITAQVQSFADALQVDRSYEVVRTQLPFDTTSAGTLSGDIGSSEGGDTPRFTVTLVRKSGK
jgi:hypothetical protein